MRKTSWISTSGDRLLSLTALKSKNGSREASSSFGMFTFHRVSSFATTWSRRGVNFALISSLSLPIVLVCDTSTGNGRSDGLSPWTRQNTVVMLFMTRARVRVCGRRGPDINLGMLFHLQIINRVTRFAIHMTFKLRFLRPFL